MAEIYVAEEGEITEGERRFVDHGNQRVGVIRAGGRLVAYLNVCPHQGGPVCDGLLIHKVEEIIDENRCYRGLRFDAETLHIVCPWHGWEFDVATGACAGDGAHRLKRFPVVERGGKVYVQV